VEIVKWSIKGDKELLSTLKALSQADYEAVVKLNMTEIYNRGKRPGGTPFITGELRQSLGLTKSTDNAYDVGYTKEYAPHVEYGHRTRGGGYVQGRFYLKANVDTQRPQLKADLLARIKKVGG
jgi:hypothetical protein